MASRLPVLQSCSRRERQQVLPVGYGKPPPPAGTPRIPAKTPSCAVFNWARCEWHNALTSFPAPSQRAESVSKSYLAEAVLISNGFFGHVRKDHSFLFTARIQGSEYAPPSPDADRAGKSPRPRKCPLRCLHVRHQSPQPRCRRASALQQRRRQSPCRDQDRHFHRQAPAGGRSSSHPHSAPRCRPGEYRADWRRRGQNARRCHRTRGLPER